MSLKKKKKKKSRKKNENPCQIADFFVDRKALLMYNNIAVKKCITFEGCQRNLNKKETSAPPGCVGMKGGKHYVDNQSIDQTGTS